MKAQTPAHTVKINGVDMLPAYNKPRELYVLQARHFLCKKVQIRKDSNLIFNASTLDLYEAVASPTEASTVLASD